MNHANPQPHVLAAANTGDIKTFRDYMADWSVVIWRVAMMRGRRTLDDLNRPNGNGGHTVGTTHLPPMDDPA